jgi:hypothetical protein
MKNEFLTPIEAAEAFNLGWRLERVFQLETLQWRVMIMPDGAYPLDVESTAREVIYQAKTGNPVAIKALRIVKADKK